MSPVQVAAILASCWLMAGGPWQAVADGPAPAHGGERTELVRNGSFAEGIDPWFAFKLDGGRQSRAPEMLALETLDLPAAGTRALRVSIAKDPKVNWPSHNYGVVCPLREHLPADREATLVLRAKSLSGATVLNIGRLGGGGNTTITLDKNWNRYELPFRCSHQAGDLLINLVPQAAPGIHAVQSGEFLLADLSVIAELPQATAMDFKYGPHPRQTFDFWRAPGTATAPVLVFIHGGGWLGGDKAVAPRSGWQLMTIWPIPQPRIRSPGNPRGCAGRSSSVLNPPSIRS